MIQPPSWWDDDISCHYFGYAGSSAYGASSDTSDMDCFGFCIPPKHLVFPYASGEIAGFGDPPEHFRVWTKHYIVVPGERKTYDFSIYNIVDFFDLAMRNNPNILDVLFLPKRCVLMKTPIAQHVLEKRHLFLHKGSFHKYRGYMFAQMNKIKNKSNASNPTRAELIKQYQYDTKFAMHVIRLALQCEQILAEHDLDLERNSEILKSIRRGEWTLEQIDQWAVAKERALELLYTSSTLQYAPDQEKIKKLLLECLEEAYGSLNELYSRPDQTAAIVQDLQNLLNKYR